MQNLGLFEVLSIRKRIDRTGYTFLALDTGNTMQPDGHRDCK